MHDATEPHWPRTFTVHERVHNDATQKRARTRTLAQVCSRWSTHTHTTPCIACARREDMNSTLSPALRDAHALDLARLRSTNLNSAPSVALFNGSTDKCTALVHSAVGTRMHASFTRRSAPSGPMYASCAPAARGLLPFYASAAQLCTFTILQQNPVTFTEPSPYGTRPVTRSCSS